MPSQSEKQRAYIFHLRGKYKNKSNTPSDQQWIWDKGWEDIKEECCMKRYKRYFSEANEFNVTKIKSIIKNEIREANLRLRSDREHREYNQAYIDYLEDYIHNSISPRDIANLASKKTDVYDDSPEAGQIEASKFIMDIINS